MSSRCCERFREFIKWSHDCCGCANKFIWGKKNIFTVLFSISVQQICKLLYSTFVSYCTLLSTNCTQFRKFTQTSFIWSLMNICIVLHSISIQHSTDCTPYTNIRAVQNWTAVYLCTFWDNSTMWHTRPVSHMGGWTKWDLTKIY